MSFDDELERNDDWTHGIVYDYRGKKIFDWFKKGTHDPTAFITDTLNALSIEKPEYSGQTVNVVVRYQSVTGSQEGATVP